jgi:hypothetical protein
MPSRPLLDHAQHLVDQFRVQRRGDFVAQQHHWPHRQRAANGDAVPDRLLRYIPRASVTASVLDDKMKVMWDAPVHMAALRWGV